MKIWGPRGYFRQERLEQWCMFWGGDSRGGSLWGGNSTRMEIWDSSAKGRDFIQRSERQ